MDKPVTIIGAGIAGLTAAIALRRHGVKVRVFEMAADVGWRLNGDFQGLENWSTREEVPEFLNELGIEQNFLCEPVHSGTIIAPGVPPAVSRSERPIFYLVRRGSQPGTLDVGLKEQALALGAGLEFNHRLESAPGPVIVATGPTRADALAMGMTFTTKSENTSIVAFDDGIAPRGYAYLLTHDGLGTLATVLYRDFRRARECFEKTLGLFRDKLGFSVGSGTQFTSYGNFFLRDSNREGNRYFVGEAAGFQDCLWGFGMRYAMMSGWLAARSIVTGEDYDRLWKQRLRPLLETSLVNRYLQEKAGNGIYRYVARRLESSAPCAFLGKQYNRSFFKQLLLPLASRSYARKSRDVDLAAKTLPSCGNSGY